MRRAIVLASGDCPENLPAEVVPQEFDQVVCVDGGLVHCLAMGWTPTLLIGDFDSTPADLLLRPDVHSVARLSFPPSKDASDLELALDTLEQGGIDEVVILGVSGGRTDHMLFNWLLVARKPWPFSLRLIDDTVDAQYVDAMRPYDVVAMPGTTFSLLAMTTCEAITTQGLEYPLSDAHIALGSTLGLSNVSTGGRVRVSMESGTLLILQVREQHSEHKANCAP